MLTERTVLGKIEILEDGKIGLREDTVIVRDGLELVRTFHRRILTPSETLPDMPDGRIRQIAQVLWTPEVIRAYQQAQRAVRSTFAKV